MSLWTRWTAAHLLERCSVLGNTVHSASFASHTLDEHADGHTTGERVRVDDYVWLHAALAEGHVDSWPFLGTNTLLAVSRRELVANDRRTRNTEGDLDFLGFTFPGVITWKRRDQLQCT